MGRAAVNHPCAALHTVDADLYGRPSAAPSRGAVLAEYVAYVEVEERGPLRGRGGTSGADSPIAVTLNLNLALALALTHTPVEGVCVGLQP